MSENLPSPTKAEKEAADWYGRLDSPVIENADLGQFMRWREEPTNRQAYERLSSSMARAEALKDDPALNAIADKAIARAARRDQAKGGGRAIAWGGGLALAAMVVTAAVIYQPLDPRYSSGVGERRVVELADGSRLVLNTNSRVRVSLRKDRRQVDLLAGQALFEVAHDAQRPFFVRAGDTQVRAIGTRFDVYRRAGDVRVTLTQGRVEVSELTPQTPSWTLDPGQEILIARDRPVAAPHKADVAAATSWTAGQLMFRDTPLAEAVSEVNRYSKRRIVLGAGAPHDRRISGVFPTGDVTAFALAASATLDLKSAPTSDGGLELGADPAAAP